ncbi:carbohydrate ABC transporter permease [Streptomyces sp. 4N509B]|uniref:carbohydrate ABC transporter permease n=1 Tax=Streptomyces sp. 4N509B TaxID=3457413 RepID=UPI003FD0E032
MTAPSTTRPRGPRRAAAGGRGRGREDGQGQGQGRRRGRGRRGLVAAGFLSPFLLLFAVTYLAPAAYALHRSFFVVERDGPFGAPREVFGGLENYARALGDAGFLRGIGRVILFGAVQYPVMLLLALVLALALDSRVVRFRRFFRLAAFAPYAVPAVVASLMWGFLYSPELSPLVGWFDAVGVRVDPLGGDTVLWSVANVVTWTYCGFNMLILLTALQAVDRDVYQAARVDGAGAWRIVWHIKLPLLRPALVLATVFSIIGILQLFTEPQVLSALSGSITSDYTPSLAAFHEASAGNYSYAAALAMMLTGVTAVLSVAFMRLAWRRR